MRREKSCENAPVDTPLSYTEKLDDLCFYFFLLFSSPKSPSLRLPSVYATSACADKYAISSQSINPLMRDALQA